MKINQKLLKMSELNLKAKVMLNTKDMSAGSGRPKPVLGPGNHVIRINSVTFDKTPYDSEAYNIMLHVETEPVQGEFEGFYKDMTDQSKGRYEGQVGRVRMSPYPYKDATLPSGREVNRDQEVLKSMIFLSEQLNKRDELDSIEADTIESFMHQAAKVFSNTDFVKYFDISVFFIKVLFPFICIIIKSLSSKSCKYESYFLWKSDFLSFLTTSILFIHFRSLM